MRVLRIAAVGVTGMVVFACGGGSSGGGVAVSESAFADACVAQSDRCHNDSGFVTPAEQVRKNCVERYQCTTQSLDAFRADAVLSCFSARDCSASSSSCEKAEVAKATDAATVAYVEKCEARRKICSFDNDYCDEGRIFVASVRDAWAACFDRDCATDKKAVGDCLDGVTKARVPACD